MFFWVFFVALNCFFFFLLQVIAFLIFSKVFITFLDLFSKSILYSGIINFGSESISILNEYFFENI